MANSLRRKDAKQLKAAHEALLEDLRSAAGLATECKARAKEAAEMITARRIMDVLKEVAADMKIEKIILAEEIKEKNPAQLEAVLAFFENVKPEVEFVPHTELKALTKECRAVDRHVLRALTRKTHTRRGSKVQSVFPGALS